MLFLLFAKLYDMEKLIKTDFDKVYNELSKLNEKWYTGDDPSFEHVWFSTSISEARQFIESLVNNNTVKGVRANIAPNSYAFAKALDLNHDSIDDVLDNLFIEHADWDNCEHITIGIPKCVDFETDNFECSDFIDDDFNALESYEGILVADCGNFEISLYSFKSKQFPKYNAKRPFKYFEGSETEKLFKPFIKKLYIYSSKK
jgi:hypothetical protein